MSNLSLQQLSSILGGGCVPVEQFPIICSFPIPGTSSADDISCPGYAGGDFIDCFPSISALTIGF